MKIAEIIPDLKSRAGAEVFFDSLCTNFSKEKNIELVVIVIWDLIDESFSHLKQDKNIKFYCCGKKRKGIDLKSVRVFKNILKNEKPDIIHTHRSVLLTYFLAFGLKKQKWDIFHTVHNIASKEAGKYEICLRRTYVKKDIIKQIGISDKISESIASVYGKCPIKTIYNGINIQRYNQLPKHFDFVCVARFSAQKNHIFLLSSFCNFFRFHPHSNLLLVGEGELMNSCKDFVHNNHLENNVIFYGSTNDAIKLINESKIFILGSLYEGNPISILEAMSAGLPIIAPNVGGIPDVVSDGRNGFLYSVNNSDELNECIEKIFSRNDLIDEISRNNRNDSKKYTIEICAKEYLDLFQKNKSSF